MNYFFCNSIKIVELINHSFCVVEFLQLNLAVWMDFSNQYHRKSFGK